MGESEPDGRVEVEVEVDLPIPPRGPNLGREGSHFTFFLDRKPENQVLPGTLGRTISL